MNRIDFPLYLSGIEDINNNNVNLLVGSLKKHECILAVFLTKNGDLELLEERRYATQTFTSFGEMLSKFVSEVQLPFFRVSLGVPGPIIFGQCETRHLPWIVNANEIRQQLNVERVYLLNDVEATAYSLKSLKNTEVISLHESQKVMQGNMALLAPGEGLGEAGLFWDGAYLRPFATEGGHTEFSPRNLFEVDFYHYLHKISGIVSWENVLSKQGIYNIYRFLRDIGHHKECSDLAQRIQKEDFLSLMQDVGKKGNSHLVSLVLDWFSEFLAREASHLVLKLKATGGLVITGEIAEKLRAFIDKDKFYKDFIHLDKMENLLKDIPIYFIFSEKSVLMGAAYYGAFIEK